MDANDWQLEMRRLLEIFERESVSSLRQIRRCFAALGRPFDENFRQYFLKVSTLRLDTSFDTVLLKQCDESTIQATANVNTPVRGKESASSSNILCSNVDNVRSLDATLDSNMLEIKIESNIDDTEDEGCGNQYGMQASDGSNDDQIEPNASPEFSCGSGNPNNETINTDMNDLNGIEVDVKAEFKMEMESPSETGNLPLVAFDPTADNGDSNRENGKTDAGPLADRSLPSTSPSAKRKSVKSSVRRFKCKDCAYTSNNMGNFRTHRLIHDAIKPFKCAHCDYAARQKTHLGTHQRTHVQQKLMSVTQDPKNGLFKCTHCDQRFTKWYSFTKHLAFSHKDNQWLFNCMHCMRRFAQKTAKDRHEIRCQNRLYECHLCQKYVTQKKFHMQEHMRTHSGAKPFECAICDKRFIQKSNLNNHLNRVHNPI